MEELKEELKEEEKKVVKKKVVKKKVKKRKKRRKKRKEPASLPDRREELENRPKRDTKFKKGNKAASLWTEETIIQTLETLLDLVCDPEAEYLSLQELFFRNRNLITLDSFYALKRRYPEIVEPYKREIEAMIIAIVNRGAMKKNYDSKIALHRMSVYGENLASKQQVEQTVIQKNVEIEIE